MPPCQVLKLLQLKQPSSENSRRYWWKRKREYDIGEETGETWKTKTDNIYTGVYNIQTFNVYNTQTILIFNKQFLEEKG